ncbi:MAG: 16S rRNA (cytosine(1402)-N(4))-methyltransferase RsmH, partial [Rhodospirillales bacterium]
EHVAHRPVMLTEVLAVMSPRDGGVYVDGTFGAGGYSRAILEAADCVVWAIDRDPDAIRRGEDLAAAYPGRLRLVHGRFGEMAALLRERNVALVDGIALDLGVSSMQLDEAPRGFSFRADGPLDMRMGSTGPTAADAVNTLAESELADIIHRLGEERYSRRIARAIVTAREVRPITGTLGLAGIVRQVVPRSRDGIDPATRTFQALRIYVNDELGELDRALIAAESLLAPGGRLAVVAFHSLEDRRVKAFLRARAGAIPRTSRHLPATQEEGRAPTFTLVKGGVTKPSDRELKANPRARSARLRAAVRTDAPPWPEECAA